MDAADTESNRADGTEELFRVASLGEFREGRVPLTRLAYLMAVMSPGEFG